MDIINEKIDIKENTIYKLDYNLLSTLLKDHSTNRNIIWATDNYLEKGLGYRFHDEITIEKITGFNRQVIKPRIKKSKQEQIRRVRDKAEVFTPSWICNRQNNLVDNAWFQEKNIFNIEYENCWKTNKEKIKFPSKSNKSWEEYVNSKRLEMSCGEAPYLVSRYDTVSGCILPICDRIGILDRKLRVVNENTTSKEDWQTWVVNAYKATFGYEWQGDSVLIARENLLYTYIDYFYDRYNEYPKMDDVMKIAEIISWNIWQMDGLKGVVPCSCKNDEIIEYTLFGEVKQNFVCKGCRKNNIKLHNGIYCKIMNWDSNRKIKFISLLK